MLTPLLSSTQDLTPQSTLSVVIVEVRIGDIASRTIEVRRDGNVALLPLSEVMKLAEIDAGSSADYVTADSIAVLLHAPVLVDWEDLSVTFRDDGTTPVSRRVARRRTYTRNRAPASILEDARQVTRRLWPDGVVLDYAMSDESALFPSQRTSLSLQFGAALLGGSIQTDARLSTANRAVMSAVWARQLSRGHTFRSVRIGALNLPFDSAVGSGILLSSEPPDGSSSERVVALDAHFDPNWDVEVLQDDVLVYSGIADGKGDFGTTIRMHAGSNRLRLRGYGPRGAAIEFGRYVLAAEGVLPVRKHSLAVAAGVCNSAFCDHALVMSGRYAPASSLTIGGTLEGRSKAGRYSVTPAVNVAVQPADDIMADAQFGGDRIGGRVSYSPAPAFELNASFRRHHFLHRSVASTAESLLAWYAAWRNRQGFAVDAAYEARLYLGSQIHALRIGTFASSNFAFVRPVVWFERASGRGGITAKVGASADLGLPLPGLHARLRVGAGDTQSGRQSITLLASPLDVQFTLGAQRDRMTDPFRLEFTINALTFAGRLFSRVARTGSTTTSTRMLSGSVGVSRSPGLSFSRSATACRGTSSIRGVVYVDGNGNGLRDQFEEALPDVLLGIGSSIVQSDTTGFYEVEVPPFTSVLVRADGESLPDDLVAPFAFQVDPVPNSATHVDVPLRRKPLRGPVNGRNGTRLTQDAEGRNAPAVHRDNLQLGVPDTNPVAHARESSNSREYESAER